MVIQVTCSTCGSSFETADSNAGKTGKCPNCQNPIVIPAAQPQAAAAAPAAAPAGAPQAAPQTVVVQVQGAQQTPGRIGPARKSMVGTILLWVLPVDGLSHFYIGQTGKGILFLLLGLLFWSPLVWLTCGFGLILYLPYALVLLADAIVVTIRINKRAIHPWRFF